MALNAYGQDAGSDVEAATSAKFELAVTEASADQVVIAVRGEIDLATAEQFREIIDEAILPGARLVIDLASTSFIDSTGLGVLAWAQAHLADSSGAVIIRSPSRSTKKILNICGLDRILTIEDGDGTDHGSGGDDRSIAD
jgi:stage II sporulation protein AA (anti-sigma F factor antagonist)